MIQIPTFTFTQTLTAACAVACVYFLIDSWILQRRINKALAGICKATNAKQAMEEAELVHRQLHSPTKARHHSGDSTPIGCGGPSILSKVMKPALTEPWNEPSFHPFEAPYGLVPVEVDTYNVPWVRPGGPAPDKDLCSEKSFHRTGKFRVCPTCRLCDPTWMPPPPAPTSGPGCFIG